MVNNIIFLALETLGMKKNESLTPIKSTFWIQLYSGKALLTSSYVVAGYKVDIVWEVISLIFYRGEVLDLIIMERNHKKYWKYPRI